LDYRGRAVDTVGIAELFLDDVQSIHDDTIRKPDTGLGGSDAESL